MIEKSSSQPSSRELRLLRLMIDVVGEERHAMSLQQLEKWLNQMVGRPLTARNGDISQLVRQETKGEITFWLSAVDD
jgi:hypothetical protein